MYECFHDFPSSCLCHKVKWPERGGKCHGKAARKRGKTNGKNKPVEQGSDYQPLREQKEKSYASKCFLFCWKEKLEMKSALEDDKPFLVELIHTVISTVETRHRQTFIRSLRQSHTFSYLHFFSSVLLHYSIHVPRFLMYTEGSSCESVLVPPHSSSVVRGRRKGQINKVIGPVIRERGEWNWRQFSFSGIMSLAAGWCQSSWCHWGWLWFDPKSLPVVFAPAVPADMNKSFNDFKNLRF